MNTLYKTAIATGISLAALLMTATTASADVGQATPTPTPDVRCTNNAYGQPSCTSIITVQPTGKDVHAVVPAGADENIILAVAALFIVSTVGYTYSKVRA